MAAYAPRTQPGRPHANPWVVAVVALAAALVGLSAWVIVDHTRSTNAPATPTTAVASAKVTAMLDARFAALNGDGRASFAQFYSPDTEFTDFGVTPPITARGTAKVITLMGTYSHMWAMGGQRITRESQVIKAGDYVAHALLLGSTPGIAVYQLDEHGKIAREWAFGN